VTIEPHPYAHGLSAGFDVDAPFAPHVAVDGGRIAPSDEPGLGIDVTWPDDEESA
jgi:L-alanine-DL-glutamate epimerase-like enolase superfamily enzyme